MHAVVPKHALRAAKQSWLLQLPNLLDSRVFQRETTSAAVTPPAHVSQLRPPLLQHPKREVQNAEDSSWAVPEPLPLVPAPNKTGLWKSRFVPLCFDNPEACYRAKSTRELLMSVAVFRACGFQPLVRHADALLKLSKRVFGTTITGVLVKSTFFAQFCAGVDQESIQPKIQQLNKAGIGAILDYAAEKDVHSSQGASSLSEENYEVIVRTYDYESEKACENNMAICFQALEAAKTLPKQGFAAIKVTALGDALLLQKMSKTRVEITRLFQRFDKNGDGYVTREEFTQVYNELFTDAADTPKMNALYEKLDTHGTTSTIDYVSFVDNLRLEDLPELVSKCRVAGPLSEVSPTERELKLIKAMMTRVRRLCSEAARHRLRLMIDAEHTYFQPAIDIIAKQMMREFNTEVPIVYNTYQCYLKDSRYRLNGDIESARREGYKFGAKLVRGAYMVLERAKAAKEGYPCPIHDTIKDTHQNYNRCVRMLIQEVASSSAEVMIASHNQYSVEMAVRSMHEFGLEPGASGVFFGQLLGMADHLSYTLGRHDYRAYKYVPFGPWEEVMPYLIRRAQENSDMMGGVGKELNMLQCELNRRLLGIDV